MRIWCGEERECCTVKKGVCGGGVERWSFDLCALGGIWKGIHWIKCDTTHLDRASGVKRRPGGLRKGRFGLLVIHEAADNLVRSSEIGLAETERI